MLGALHLGFGIAKQTLEFGAIVTGEVQSTERNPRGLSILANRKVLTMLALGFSAGLPILLIFSTLSLWLSEAGVSKSAVTYFSWAALGYSFKFVWAPLVDKVPLPVLSATLGRRRAWLLVSQFAVIAAIVWMGSIDPQIALEGMAIAAVVLGFSSATQDVVIDAYRIESASEDMQAMLSSAYIAGYRIGMVAAGAGSLRLAETLGTTAQSYDVSAWRWTYFCMAALMSVGVITTLLAKEPQHRQSQNAFPYSVMQYLRFVAIFLVSAALFVAVYRLFPVIANPFEDFAGKAFGFFTALLTLVCALGAALGIALFSVRIGVADRDMVEEGYIQPVREFFLRYGKVAVWILLLVGFYRVSDIVMGVVANLFYQDLGYSKTEISDVAKTFGLIMTIVGSFVGGFLSLKFGVMRVLLAGAILSALTNLLFMVLAGSEPNLKWLIAVITADNLSAGLAVAAFVAWLSSLTSVSFTAMQYAIFSSTMTLFPKLLGGYSGTMVENIGYANFFLFTALLGVPVVVLVLYLMRKDIK